MDHTGDDAPPQGNFEARGQRRGTKPNLNDMQVLQGYRNKRSEFKKSYSAVPRDGGVSFCQIPTVLLESAVWRGLSIYEYRFITDLLVVHARAGGKKNGELVLPHVSLKDRIRGDKIKATIAKLESVRLIEVTHQGRAADPSRYRLTFLGHIERSNGKTSHYPPGNEWIEIENAITAGRHPARAKRHNPPAQKIDSHRCTSAPESGAKSAPENGT